MEIRTNNLRKVFKKEIKKRNQFFEKLTGISDFFKLLQPITLVLGFISATWQYQNAKEKEYLKEFFDERMKLYSELVDVSSKIVTSVEDSEEQRQAVKNFKRINMGKSVFLSDKEVITAKLAMGSYILYCIEKQPGAPNNNFCTPTSGAGISLAIARAARNSIVDTSHLSLKKLDEKNLYLSKEANDSFIRNLLP